MPPLIAKLGKRLLIISGLIAVMLIGYGLYRHRLQQAEELVPAPLPGVTRTEASADMFKFHVHLSQAEKAHILDGTFAIVANTEAMPPNVKAAFAIVTSEKTFALANPGEKFQFTDVVDEPGLPFRRLVFAGTRDREWFIHYERGGIAHDYYVVVISVDPQNRMRFLWGGAGGGRPASDLTDLRSMVAAGRFADDMFYSW